MRSLILVAAVCGSAYAKPAPEPRPQPVAGDFWRNVIEPHHDEVESLLEKCRTGFGQLGPSIDVASRQAIARDLIGVLRYARRLEPDNLDVLNLLAQVADETGDARTAREALQAIVAITGEENAGADVLDRIGAAAIDAGRLDEAIRVLREAQAPTPVTDETTERVLAHLATALALAGRPGDAIDVLSGALPDQIDGGQLVLVRIALVVQLDRDEQRGAAFEQLDRMQAQLGDQLAIQLAAALAQMRFAPAEDERYYRALVNEVAGDYSEARTEWLLYAADTAAPYRRRALDHAHAIDAMAKPPQVPHAWLVPPPPFHQLVVP